MKPIERILSLFDEKQPKTRREAMAIAEEAGMNAGTGSTQFYRWKSEATNSAPAAKAEKNFVCTACGMRFKSAHAFDAHRVGKYKDEHPHYGRSCLSASEMRDKGFEPNEDGAWRVPMDTPWFK